MPRDYIKVVNTEPCEVCGVVTRYKGDVPRHNRLHSTENAAMMYKCPFDGCQYQNLQKSNLNTHISTHTGEKPHACPDCEFRTADPGSLTRHRKRTHAYIPKHNSANAKSVGTKQSRRHAPYRRRASEESSSASLISSPQEVPEKLQDFSTFLDSLPAALDTLDLNCDAPQDDLFSYPWDKDLFQPEQTCGTSDPESYTPPSSGPVPFHLFPASGAGQQLEKVDEYPSNYFDAYVNQYEFTHVESAAQIAWNPICPVDTHFDYSQPSSVNGMPWMADATLPELPISPPCVDEDFNVNWDDFSAVGSSPSSFASSSPSPSDFSDFSDSPPPSSSSYSSPLPSDFTFSDYLSSELLASPEDFNFLYPEPISAC
ncbi:hypothetical protein FPV67DRAFT_1217863 [Lyophyllum atratum]|nr:hypothetical protein FPV67DRAFT_1217863 [Lyophyllum atratum]